MTTQRLRSICLEIYETLNQLNSGFIFNIFRLSSSNRTARKQYILNLENIRPHKVKFSDKNLRALGCKNMEQSSTTYLPIFKILLKSQDGVSCQCNLCKTFRKQRLCFLGYLLLYTQNTILYFAVGRQCKSRN